MKKFISIILTFVLITSVVVSSGCSRQPSKVKTTKIMKKFFKKYHKKYPESIIGKHPVQNINILAIEEVHKNFVAAYAILDLDGGMAIQTRFTFLNKPPFGWKASSWENMGMASFQPLQ